MRRRSVELRRYQIGHLAEAHLDRSPWSLTTADLLSWLATQQWAPETRKSYRSALRSFYGWAVQAGHTKRDPSATLPAVRTDAPPPRPAPDAVLSSALRRASDRDRLILLLAAYGGLRRAEIARLRWSDLDLETATVRVVGKGGKVRTLPLHPLLLAPAAGTATRAATTGGAAAA